MRHPRVPQVALSPDNPPSHNANQDAAIPIQLKADHLNQPVNTQEVTRQAAHKAPF